MTLPAAWAVQMAVFETLSTDPELQNFVGDPARIYDAVPPQSTFPLITLGADRAEPLDGVPGGYTHDLRIRVMSKWGGRREVKLIADLIHARLQQAAPSVEGHQIVQCRLLFSDTIRPADPETFQSVMRFRILTQPSEEGS